MSDIFGGVEPPRWLQDLTRQQPGELGSTLGLALGAGLLSLQPNEDGDGLKGIQQGLSEARMAESDPNWKVKQKQLEGQVVGNWARAATEWQSFDAANKDMAAWTTHDLPAISKFQEELKTNPEAVPPIVESGKGIQAIAQLEKQQLAMQQMRLRQDNAKINIENQKTSVAFDQAVSAAPVTVGAAIDELPNQGWNLDRQGKRTTPSTRALQIYNDWATGSGQTPEKAFGYKPNAAEVARIRGDEQRKTETKKGEIKTVYEETRQKDRKELEEVKQKYRVDIEKMKLDANATGKGGKPVSEDEFVNRHMNSVFNALYKETSNPQQALADADRALRARYRVDHKAPPSTTTTNAAPASVSSTNAAPTDAKDPLGLFK